MNKKRLATIVVSVLAIAVLAIGSTLAYFTSNDKAGNSFVMGNVKIDLKESQDDGTTWVDKGLTYDQVMPGSTMNKLAVVNVDPTSEDCYIRVKMTVTTTGISDADKALLITAINTEAAAHDFVAGTDGYYYFKNSTAHAGDSLTFLNSFVIPTSIGNDSANGTFAIDIEADAIQAANITFGDTTNTFFTNYIG